MAVLVTGLRIALPRLDAYQQEIQTWVNDASGLDFEIGSVKGFWRNTHPSLSLSDLQANLSGGVKEFSVKQVDVEFDLLQSLFALRPQVSELVVDGIHVDISGIDLFASSEEEQSSSNDGKMIRQLERLLLRQLNEFSLTNSSIVFNDIAGERREVDIERLNWLNQDRRHRAEGEVTVKDVQLNSVSVIADFTDHDGLSSISGDFYLQGKNFDITPWVKPYLAEGVEVEKGRVSLNTWITLDKNKPVDAYLEVSPSELKWREPSGEENSLVLNSGVMKLEPQGEGFQVNAQDLSLSTNQQKWPDINFALQWAPEKWSVNANKLQLERLAPILDLLPDMQETDAWVEKVQLGGSVEDIRVSMGKDIDSLRYSATLKQGRMNYWELIPGFHTLQAKVAGNIHKANAKVSLLDDTLPYGQVFQAPLRVRQAQVDVVWENSEDGWSLWADKVSVATPDLQVLGAFKLDFPKDAPAFLSFYAEADLLDAGQTWRYLPTLAMGQSLTDYLSEGIRGGKVHTAKLLWYGELSKFPYNDNSGIFQAWVPLRQTRFSFSSAWPPLTDMQLDLLFQNETMFLDSRDAKLLDIKAQRISGQIPRMAGDGHIEIFAAAKAKGSDVRDYMNASPLVDSVGATLTTIDIGGEVESQFELYIPFHEGAESRAWGYADLKDNDINISSPPMTLKKATGRITFDNDLVSSSGLSANLLDQPISLDFTGQNAARGYDTKIDLVGDWQVKPLIPYLGKTWLEPISGHAPWNMGIDLQINDVGFTYQLDTKANLKFLKSTYPAPLAKESGVAGLARLQASGNQESISARLQIPNAKFQTEIELDKGQPKLVATNTVIAPAAFVSALSLDTMHLCDCLNLILMPG
ncbi:possible exported protein [Vibrio ishigakensis]|uniref:Possible exported protein n=1 Tax=Vibrio ishigakensis TaxID=1481914 RepID=A0A0B8QRA9_9VIBR|nr:possible exported protein [Vibrio ishigakensis]